MFATAHNINSIAVLKERYCDQVLVLEADVTNALQVQNAMNKGNEYFGRLDVVFNNAGYSLVGTIQGSTDEVKTMYETKAYNTEFGSTESLKIAYFAIVSFVTARFNVVC